MVFQRVVELALALGVRSIKDLPGCWEYQIDEHWWIALNGHDQEITCSHSATKIKPYCGYIEFNGWPAGYLSVAGGVLAAGLIANEKVLIAALDRAIAREKAKGAQV